MDFSQKTFVYTAIHRKDRAMADLLDDIISKQAILKKSAE
jgi:hypothetical protein